MKGIDWINMAQDRDRWHASVNAVMNLRAPYNSGYFLSSLGRVRFSERTLLHRVSYRQSKTSIGKKKVWLNRMTHFTVLTKKSKLTSKTMRYKFSLIKNNSKNIHLATSAYFTRHLTLRLQIFLQNFRYKQQICSAPVFTVCFLTPPPRSPPKEWHTSTTTPGVTIC